MMEIACTEALSWGGYEISESNKLVGNINFATMRKAIMDFFDDSSISPEDILIFYYSGHGIPDVDGDVYLATSEIEPAFPYRNGFSFGELDENGSKNECFESSTDIRLLLQRFS